MGVIAVDEIVGEARMTPESQPEVVTILRSLPVSIMLRRGYYHRWLAIVGLPVTPAELNRVASMPVARMGTRG